MNYEAMQQTIGALRLAGRLEDADEALIVAAETLAMAVDADPGNAALWREYRAFEQRLRTTGEGTGDTDLASLLSRMSAPMVDSPD